VKFHPSNVTIRSFVRKLTVIDKTFFHSLYLAVILSLGVAEQKQFFAEEAIYSVDVFY